MAPKKLTAFRLGITDRRRLQKLAQKKEWTHAQVVREALKRFAEKEGIK